MLLVHEYPGGFGGAERYLDLLAGGLLERDVAVGAVVFAGDPGRASPFVDRLAATGVDVSLHRWRAHPLPLARAVRRLSPDVIHWNAVDPFAFRGGLATLVPWGPPGVLTDHLPMLRTGPHWETTRRAVNRWLGAVIVVGEEGAVAAREHWTQIRRLRVVPNGVRTGHGTLRQRSGRDPVHLLFAGRLTEQKDPLFCLDVLAAARASGIDSTLTYAGEGPLGDEIRATVRNDPSLGTGVAVLGFVEDTGAAMGGADVYLAPARYEGLPLTPLEAMASGLPLVLSDIPPHREIARRAEPGAVTVVPIGDVNAWTQALAALCDRLEDASRAALTSAARFSVDRMVEQTLDVYAEVLEG